jgi:Transposase
MVTTRSQYRTPSPEPDSRGKKGNGEYPTPARARVFQLRRELGLNPHEVEEQMGIPVRTQTYILRSNSERRTGKNRPGREPKLCGDTLDRIIKSLEGRYKIRRLNYESQIKQNDLHVSVKTLKCALHVHGLRKYRAAHKRWLQTVDRQRRVEFAKQAIHWPA